MPTQQINVLQEEVSLKQLCEEVARLQKIVRYLLNGNLDFNNIAVKGIKADNIDVINLSAISADLGVIDAGEINGIIINGVEINGSTFNGGEINVTTDINVGSRVNLNEVDGSGKKGIYFGNNSITSMSSDLSIDTGGYIILNADGGIYANNPFHANGGISVGVNVMGGDGVTPVTLIFTHGTLSGVV